MSSQDAMPGIDLSETFAPIYWGFIVSLFLGGMTILQAYMYFSASATQSDRHLVRFTALLMLVLDLSSSILIAQSVYYYLIPNFGSLVPLASVTPGLSAECLVSTMITFNSQMYFVYQLYIVKRLGNGVGRWLVLGSITGSAIMAFAGGVACVASMYIFHHGVLGNRNHMFSIFFGIAKGFGTITDVLATIAMCMYLTSARTGIAQTNSLLNRLIGFVIHRGALVTLIQALLLITFYVAPTKLYWLAFHVNVTKLYANTFFAMLNGRNHYKERRNARSTTALGHTFSSTRNSHKIGFGTFAIQESGEHYSHTESMPTVTKTVEVADI